MKHFKQMQRMMDCWDKASLMGYIEILWVHDFCDYSYYAHRNANARQHVVAIDILHCEWRKHANQLWADFPSEMKVRRLCRSRARLLNWAFRNCSSAAWSNSCMLDKMRLFSTLHCKLDFTCTNSSVQERGELDFMICLREHGPLSQSHYYFFENKINFH